MAGSLLRSAVESKCAGEWRHWWSRAWSGEWAQSHQGPQREQHGSQLMPFGWRALGIYTFSSTTYWMLPDPEQGPPAMSRGLPELCPHLAEWGHPTCRALPAHSSIHLTRIPILLTEHSMGAGDKVHQHPCMALEFCGNLFVLLGVCMRPYPRS